MLHSTTAATWTTAALGVRIADDRLYMKGEHLQATGRSRRAGWRTGWPPSPPDARERGVITLSAGNASAAFAWAGRAAGVPVTVVMPAGAVRSKVDACLGYGARVVLKGTHVGEAVLEMERLRDEEGLVFCHPFDDPAVIAGSWDGGLELVDDLPDVDVVVVGVGGGGLISGVASAVKGRRPSARVYGVEPDGSNALTLALERDEVVAIQPGHAWRTGWARRSPAPGRWRWRDATWTTSSSSMTRRSWPGCGSSSSAASSWSSRPARRRSPRSCRGGSRSGTASASRCCCRAGTSTSDGSVSCWPAPGGSPERPR